MKIENFIDIIGTEFFTGVPDSGLAALCNYLMYTYGVNPYHHIIAANEGNCVAIAAGYHLATGRIPVVYLQNSGEGNIINPVVSLLNDKVYAIPMLFIIGWRGEPGIKDEPQHIYQGEITIKLLEDMDIKSFIISIDTAEKEIEIVMDEFRQTLEKGKSVAFIVRSGALYYDGKVEYRNDSTMLREEVIRHIVKVSGNDPIIATTGKISRELYEVRKANNQDQVRDFLNVGSMGHSSSIALGVALNTPNKRIWCIDGDGAVLMHMGAVAVVGVSAPKNMIHIIINNGAHDSVGGMPTVMNRINLPEIARACGYPYVASVDTFKCLDAELEIAKRRKNLTLIEVKCAIGARSNLGRPNATTVENKKKFMEYLRENSNCRYGEEC